MNKMHLKFNFLKTTSGMRPSQTPSKTQKCIERQPNPPSIPADDFHPIGVVWDLFFTLGLARKNSNPPPFFKETRPAFS